MDPDGWTLPPEPSIGVVVDDEPGDGHRIPESDGADPPSLEAGPEWLTDALEDRTEASLVIGSAESVRACEPSLLVAVGDRALRSLTPLVTDHQDLPPVLPVGTGPGVSPVPGDTTSVIGALDALADGDCTVVTYPLLAVEAGAIATTALFDVTLVTDEPARISEYRVESERTAVAQFRADGVVVTTPAGSHGYARAANGPSLSRSVPAVSVVPIAPFTTRTRRWVLPDDALTLTVVRDQDLVTLCVDDREVGGIDTDDAVSLRVDPARSLRVLETPVSVGPFDHRPD